MAILIADSGATKCEWCVVEKGKIKKTVFTLGISPYFLNGTQVEDLVRRDLHPEISRYSIEAIFYYGTGCKNPENRRTIKNALKRVFPSVEVDVNHDLLGAARAVCLQDKGIACILGTGSNSCFYNGKKIVKNSPGLGYVLGDEGSGAYLGKKVVQYYLYKTFDEELQYRFDEKFKLTDVEILDKVYKHPLPNRFLAGFTLFLAENRGHFMVENIIEDGLNDFFFNHLCKYNESWKLPVHFVGGVAFGFRDVVMDLTASYEFELGKILQHPMEGLVAYHSS
ncbi:N-acetylglucosamine kinase [Flavihumibacter solisilvae]|jgi:N-acetylglucosamine kinase-like BadF-type ATPase|uniref:N-acetylglucosamine kinase n=1 Tax=Flavihumibacter solisilvae TaxID=1349421 RepID=A0A0C1L2B5_9BACT|nr:N-acetylglucosamine kinase [Flavihumibacter solisilvae]KIC94142.1 N-acetylglucosamine kinase [Flavihumibacter solisilvae]